MEIVNNFFGQESKLDIQSHISHHTESPPEKNRLKSFHRTMLSTKLARTSSSGSNSLKTSSSDSRRIRICRWIINILSLLCCIKLDKLDHKQSPTASDKSIEVELKRSFDKSRQILKGFVIIIFLVTFLRRAGSSKVKFDYDLAKLQFDQIDAAVRILNTTNKLKLPSANSRGYLGYSVEFLTSINLIEFREQLRQTKDKNWLKLRQFGSFLEEEGFFDVTIHIADLGYQALHWLAPFVYYNIFHQFDDVFLINAIFNRKEEIDRAKKSINTELASLLNSGKNFLITNACEAFGLGAKLNNWTKASKSELDHSFRRLNARSRLKRHVNDHRQLESMIIQWKTNSQLRPVNLSVTWLQAPALVFIIVNTFVFGHLFIIHLFDNIYQIRRRFFASQPNGMDYFVMLEFDLAAIVNYGHVLYYAAFFAVVSSHLWYTSWLINRFKVYNKYTALCHEYILSTIDATDSEIEGHPGYAIDEGLVFQLNKVLLSALLEYRVYLNQLERTKPFYAFSGATRILTLVFLSGMCRIFQTYWPMERHGRQDVVEVGLIFCSTFLVPLSKLESLGIKALRQMNYMLTQCLNVNEKVLAKTHQQVYFDHTIQLYHKEIFDTKKRVERLAVWALFCHLTYRNVVKIHYWFFLFVVAIFYETESWRKIFGRRLDDPFGFFKT